MVKYITLAILISFLSLLRSEPSIVSELDNKDNKKTNVKIFSKEEVDMIISIWYLNQYSAIDEIEKVTKLKSGIGTKVNESYDSFLDKQRVIVLDDVSKNAMPERFDYWYNFQIMITKDLCNSSNTKFVPASRDLDFNGKVNYCIDMQRKIIARLVTSDK